MFEEFYVMHVSDFHLKADFVYGKKINTWRIFHIKTNQEVALITLLDDNSVIMNSCGVETFHNNAKEAYYSYGEELYNNKKRHLN